MQERVVKIASDTGTKEYKHDLVQSQSFLEKLAERGVDIFASIERKVCV